jgi:membrane protein YqaA with SNARE-associated domain
MFDFSPEAGLVGLFLATTLSATLLPGGAAEVLLVAILHQHPEQLWPALAVASAGNLCGGATSYVIGRVLPNKAAPKAMALLHKHGYWAMLLSWIPLFGDALSLAAGWLRLNPWIALPLYVVGKFMRLGMVAGGWVWFERSILPMFAG